MLELRNLSAGYGRIVVAQGLCATLEPGTLACLLGSNGAGKSTLLRTMAALLPPIGGEVRIGGMALDEYTPQQLARTIGVVLTERVDVRDMTVRELVAMGRQPYTGFWGGLDAEDEARVDESVALTGIGPLCSRHVHTLSDGERQKAMVAKALAQGTPLILLDEPTAFLDFPSKVELMRLLHRLAHVQHKAVLLSTHDVELALQTADELWLLSADGLKQGSPAKLADDGILEHFFAAPGLAFDRQTRRFSY